MNDVNGDERKLKWMIIQIPISYHSSYQTIEINGRKVNNTMKTIVKWDGVRESERERTREIKRDNQMAMWGQKADKQICITNIRGM